jgi:hypothetical protein
MSSNLSRKDGNAFVEALNARSLCACATLRQLVQLGVPGPYLPCELHVTAAVSETELAEHTLASRDAQRTALRCAYYGTAGSDSDRPYSAQCR